jgi:hypothetical protein
LADEAPAAEERVEEPETEAPEQIDRDSTGQAEAADSPDVETQAAETAPENVPSLNFDDGDLLELPPLVEETGIRPQPKVEPVAAAKPEPAVAENTAEPETETANTPTAAESETMQSFPPDLIEAIAQKVAEKISAKTMNDVLPQITELVMKKLAEEKLKNEQ